MTVTLRETVNAGATTKGTELTHAELDANFLFTQTGTGAVERTIAGRFQDSASILDFIPVSEHAAILASTSTTDLSTYIQAAVDAKSHIYVPAGQYTHASTISLKANFTLEGDGYKSFFRYTGAGVGFQAVGSSDEWNTAVRNVRIQDAGTGTHGLRLKDLANFSITGCYITGWSTAGIHLTGTAVTGYCICVHIFDNWIQSNTGDGILFDTVNAINQIAIHANRIQGNSGRAIALTVTGRAISILGNDIEGSGGTCELYINGGSCAGVDVSGNYFETSASHPAILAADTADQYGVSIKGNFFQGGFATNAITLGVSAYAQGFEVSGNAFAGSWTNAISPAAVKGAQLGPNYVDGSIVHVATPGANSVGVYVINQNGTSQTLQGSSARAQKYYLVTGGTAQTFDMTVADTAYLDIGDTSAFSINAPTTPLSGQRLLVIVANNSGGAMGAITWNAAFLLAGAFTNPANTKKRTIEFEYYAGIGWVEAGRAAADI